MKILIADDDLDLTQILSFTLQRVGFQPLVACDVRSALSLHESESPVLALVEFNLASSERARLHQDGFELILRRGR